MNKFTFCWSEASEYSDRDAYISDLSLSSIWEDVPYAEVPEERIRWLSSIWDIRHGGINALLKHEGINRTALSSRFAIPYRTVQNWCLESSSNSRQCPDYVLGMMTSILIPMPTD